MALRRKSIRNPLPVRLRQLREMRGLSQKELGVLAGIDPSAASPRINQYERGKHAPNFSVAARLAEVLGAPTAFLYAEEDALANQILSFREEPITGRRRVPVVARGS
ncbi:MAG: helix-turn-helix transcriptional regulator [Xanthomonadales bacterium]|nr:helix-turn-helix transcriptional regulator [Xanthomonadales bacterium]